MRKRIVWGALALLLLVDLARSFWAREGFRAPVSMWQPTAEQYSTLAWPPGIDVPATAPEADRLYAQHCAVCHGAEGRGNGPAAPSLIPRPRDFVLADFHYKTTGPSDPPLDDDLLRTIDGGLAGTAMPAFGDLVTHEQELALVAKVKSFSHRFDAPETGRLIAVPPPPSPLRAGKPPGRAAGVDPPSDPASVARGAASYAKNCEHCHGADGRSREERRDVKNQVVIARDLTAPWSFEGGANAPDVFRRITDGVGVMPSFDDAVPEAERWDLVHYVASIARTPPWEPGGTLAGPGVDPDPVRRGAYLVRAEMCPLCHTQIDATGIYRADDAALAGGMRVGAWPHGVYVARNLTGDGASGLGNWSPEQIARAFHDGRAPDRVLNYNCMPWEFLHRYGDDDAKAIAAYLKTLPAVENHVPLALRYGVLETILGKLTLPMPGVPASRLTFAEGDFATPDGRDHRLVPQTVLTVLESILALLAAAALLSQAKRRVAVACALAGVFVIGWILYDLPNESFIPPDQISAGALSGFTMPDTSAMAPERSAMVKRGALLFQTASCAMCHGGDASGGFKVSWKPFGTYWTMNLTPDEETGLGTWSDAEIERAIRSGVAKDGRQLHWQAMIWDLASHWDEEDLRSLVYYLRAIPPVKRKIPAPRGPAADDCATYTFYTVRDERPGCT